MPPACIARILSRNCVHFLFFLLAILPKLNVAKFILKHWPDDAFKEPRIISTFHENVERSIGQSPTPNRSSMKRSSIPKPLCQENPDLLTVGGPCYPAESLFVSAYEQNVFRTGVLHDIRTVGGQQGSASFRDTSLNSSISPESTLGCRCLSGSSKMANRFCF